jgi:putative transposase
VLVQSCWDKGSALKLMRKLLKKQGYAPHTLVTDKLASYGAQELSSVSRHAMNRAYARTTALRIRNHVVRRRERQMQGFQSAGSAQRYLSAHATAYNTFNLQRVTRSFS